MRKLAIMFVLLTLAGCKTYNLSSEWKPLTKVVERPKLPFASDTATTTVGAHVYVVDLKDWLEDYPPGSVKFHALMLHEREHARRQFRYQGLPGEMAKTAWIARYLTDPKFMLQEEQAGFYLAIRHLQSKGAWKTTDTLRVAVNMSKGYKTLGGKRMTSFAEAKKWIEDVLAGRWKP